MIQEKNDDLEESCNLNSEEVNLKKVSSKNVDCLKSSKKMQQKSSGGMRSLEQR